MKYIMGCMPLSAKSLSFHGRFADAEMGYARRHCLIPLLTVIFANKLDRIDESQVTASDSGFNLICVWMKYISCDVTIIDKKLSYLRTRRRVSSFSSITTQAFYSRTESRSTG